ncbi:efflux RND transporter periplasmic adaptor subunit [Halomonas sp. M4R5S39]|uniref:efflux RND transporter periplasmic adaptor subunit n=1 Tax=Halomonas kalidii TaxID=3043293 RepID=UPI0024A9B424|nr:efflux RND transporter periplasmic adaptor subunit [Halomonas kalidii]MDI5986984.1 efflux RND transporter periplasmic adaptor subunit [Halomonas kalidii]
MGRGGHATLALGLVIGLATLLVGCDAAPAETESVEEGRAAVRVMEVRASAPEEWLRFPGTVRARERATLAFLHAGVLRERHVARGQRVAEGEPLAVLHNPSLVPALAAAEGQVKELDAHLARLRRDVERARTLRGRNLVAEEELDRLESELEANTRAREQAEARRSEAQAQVEELTLHAPFAAEVTDLLVEPGDFVTAGQAVLELSGVDGREVEIRVPAALGERLATGMPVQVIPTLRVARFQGRVASVGRAGTALAPVIVRLEADARLAPGEPVRVHLAVATAESLQVPLTAVLDPGGHAPHVLALTEDDVVRRVPVMPGRVTDDWVTISASLAPRQRVVTAGQGRLEEGDWVRVLP